MNNNFKILLLGTSLSLIPQYAAAQCAVTDCLQLGYTSLQKCDNGLKCPFGEYWACPKVEEKAVLGQCTGYAKNCKIGDILNNDGTCTTDKASGKTPIGVVIYIGGDNCGQAMALNIIKGGNRYVGWDVWDWALEDSFIDIVGVDNVSGVVDAVKDFNSCQNTAKIIKQCKAEGCPAAWATYNYVPDSATNTKGKWCLPALGVLNSAHGFRTVIDQSFAKVGGTILGGSYTTYWSSTEITYDRAWSWDAHTGSPAYVIKQGGSSYGTDGIGYGVRPVIEF